ncbi:hypothetical protein GQ600_27550 [Phytophthora cactorum]|nr:hypothetical protein GQ600_27550 [Phytophthora cactorum]
MTSDEFGLDGKIIARLVLIPLELRWRGLRRCVYRIYVPLNSRLMRKVETQRPTTDNRLGRDYFGKHHNITNWWYHNPGYTSLMLQSDCWPSISLTAGRKQGF